MIDLSLYLHRNVRLTFCLSTGLKKMHEVSIISSHKDSLNYGKYSKGTFRCDLKQEN